MHKKAWFMIAFGTPGIFRIGKQEKTVPLGADGRPRQHSALLTAWLVRGFFHRALRGEKTGAQIV